MVDAVPGGHIIERDALLGCEFAGRLADGTRVMGVASGMALATTIVTTSRHYWRVPDAWTMRQGATVVVAYATAYYALCVRGAQVYSDCIPCVTPNMHILCSPVCLLRKSEYAHGRLQPHESVLIHSGAGGVGMAAISVALAMGCTVYTTVGLNCANVVHPLRCAGRQ